METIYGTGGLMGYSVASLYNNSSILIGRKGTIDKIRFLNQPFWAVDTTFYTIINEDYVYPQFLYYYLLQVDFTKYDEGTTIPSLRVETLNRLKLLIPNKEYQFKIISILSSLDDKIELNNRINAYLEQQAQAIFTEFISGHHTSSVVVEDIVLTANTGADAIQKAPIVDYDTGIRCVRVGDMSNQRPVHEWGFTNVTSEVFNQYQLHKDDIVVTRTASLGLNRLISEDLNAVYNNGLIRISINHDIVYPLIVYHQFQTEDFRNYISKINGETSVRPNMKINYLLNYSFDIPIISDQAKLVSIIQPLFEAKEKYIVENQILSSLRDALLPKLMSGEIDVSTVNI